MLDWIGSLQVRERAERRIALSLSHATPIFGWFCTAIGLAMALRAARTSAWLAITPMILAAAGLLLASLRRRLVFDRGDGVLRIEQSVFGLTTRTVVPLFHLRAVVVVAYGHRRDPSHRRKALARYVAYLARRTGGEPIYLDESRRCARLLQLAEQIAEVSELRLEYDNMRQAG